MKIKVIEYEFAGEQVIGLAIFTKDETAVLLTNGTYYIRKKYKVLRDITDVCANASRTGKTLYGANRLQIGTIVTCERTDLPEPLSGIGLIQGPEDIAFIPDGGTVALNMNRRNVRVLSAIAFLY